MLYIGNLGYSVIFWVDIICQNDPSFLIVNIEEQNEITRIAV